MCFYYNLSVGFVNLLTAIHGMAHLLFRCSFVRFFFTCQIHIILLLSKKINHSFIS